MREYARRLRGCRVLSILAPLAHTVLTPLPARMPSMQSQERSDTRSAMEGLRDSQPDIRASSHGTALASCEVGVEDPASFASARIGN